MQPADNSNPNPILSDGFSKTAAMPAQPSWQGRAITRVARVFIKRWKLSDPPAVVRQARRIFGLGHLWSSLHTSGLMIEKVEASTSRGERVRGEWLYPRKSRSKDHVLLYFHGGGYVSCSTKTHRPITCALARSLQTRVFSLEYRLAPEHPFPAAVDDAVAAFQWLVENGVAPERIALAGDSAGAGLSLATVLRLRMQRGALPASIVCLCPWVDLTAADQYSNPASCAMFRPNDVSSFASQYLNGAPARTPEASPLFGDLHGLPPLLIQVSSTELLFDDARRLHEKAISCGVPSTLKIYPGLLHVWQLYVGTIPEAKQALEEVASFVTGVWANRELQSIRARAREN